MKTKLIFIISFISVLTGCARHYEFGIDDSYGFFWGIWHGLIFPIALIANFVSWALSLIGLSFMESIQIIGRPNTGFFYYVGFAIGIASSSGAASNK